MNNRSAQHAQPRLALRAFAVALAACICLLVSAGSAAAAAPDVTIGSYPPLNSQLGTFSFDADGPALKFQCKLDAGVFTDCTSPIQLSGLSVSTHTFSVRAIGLDNSVGTAAVYTWTIDITKPAVPTLTSPPDNLLTNNATPTFSGNAEPFAHVPVFDGSTQIANPQAGADGSWTYTPSTALTDGTHPWRVRAIDAAGNRSDFTTLRSLKIDTVAPPAPVVLEPLESAHLNSWFPKVRGTAEPQSTVAAYDGATLMCSTSANPAGDWVCTDTVQLTDGTHVFNFVSRDGAGNESSVVTRTVEIDATPPPAPTLDTPLDGFATTATSLTVRGTADPISLVKVLVNGVEVADETAGPDGNWSHTFSSLEEGDYAFAAKEVDDFDNRSASSNVANVRIDRTAPTVTVTTHPSLQTNLTSADFGLTASEPNVDFECALDGGGWQPCDSTPDYSGLPEAVHNFKAHATDRAGNVGDDSAVFTWTIDLTPPDAPVIDSPLNGATVTTARPRFQGHSEPGSAVEVFAGAASLGTAPAHPSTGAWALTAGSDLPQGANTIKARAIDAAGNVGAFGPTQQLIVDSVAPLTTIQGAPTGPTRADKVTVFFSADDPQATFGCSLDTAAFTPCTTPYTTPSLIEGPHTIRVRGTDQAGNVELPVPSVSFTVDRTAPSGLSILIAGSAGNDGIPSFQIASNDSSATARCKIDNGPFVPCSGQYKPATTAGIHALTIRYTDPAGNEDDQVFAFDVVPVPATTQPPSGNSQNPTPAPVCKILGANGLTTGRLKIVTASGAGRDLKLTLSSSTAALVRVDALVGGSSIGSAPFAIKAGSSKLALKLKRAPASGTGIALTVRFYSAKREFGTAKLVLAVQGKTVRPASGAKSTLDPSCPIVGGVSAGAKFTVTTAAVGARSFRLNSNGKRPGLIALKVYRAGGGVPVANTIFAVGAGKQTVTIKLLTGATLARDGYKFTYDSLGPGGRQSSGRGAFLVR